MHIIINNIPTEVLPDETLIEVARRTGHSIPSLCYAKGAKHKSSCMVCAVKNKTTGQIIPSCTTYPTENMDIDTNSEEVKQVRTLSLELLLSDHRADCEAPCSIVCPQNLDIERLLTHYDKEEYKEAFMLISCSFPLPEISCDTCKAPCEKACRRGTVDKPVSIREIISKVVAMHDNAILFNGKNNQTKKENRYLSRLGRFTSKEKERLKENINTSSNCLHCACAGQRGCKLRLYATEMGIKRSRYDSSSELSVMKKLHVTGKMWFEEAKCIRCGLCVYNSENGFTFKDRGFGMQIIIPEENKSNVKEELAALCPTGAIYLDQDSKLNIT